MGNEIPADRTLRDQKERPRITWLPFLYGLILLFIWILIAALWQGGWRQFGSFWAAYFQVALAAVTVAALAGAVKKGPIHFLATVACLFTIAWLVFAGPFGSWRHGLQDFACLALATALTGAIGQLGARFGWCGASKGDGEFLLLVLLAWVLTSCASAWLTTPLPTNPERFESLGAAQLIVPEDATRWEDLRIGLALSGGGYRAAILHAGTLQALEKLGVRATHLSTVSGGSIIGAYYSIGGDPKTFVQAARDRRLDLQRRLLLLQNAVRLPFPFKVPKVGVELFPWYRFDRLDVQRDLLQEVLYETAEAAETRGASGDHRPEIMIATTDLTYGFQVGLLDDGILKLGEGPRKEGVYRGEIFEPESRWSLAQRVAVSGAFPLAFPSRPYRVRVKPRAATGRGIRELLLVDGGIRDNSGVDLLLAADRSAELAKLTEPIAGPAPEATRRFQEEEKKVAEEEFMSPAWDLDTFLISDGGAALGVLEDPVSSLEVLPRAFAIAEIEIQHVPLTKSPCDKLRDPRLAPHFSPARQMIEPSAQFNGKNDSDQRAELERIWQITFDPALYPESVLKEIVRNLPPESRSEAEPVSAAFRKAWATHRTDGSQWTRSFKKARESHFCDGWQSEQPEPARLLPGSCDAAHLLRILSQGLMQDLEVFRSTSTLNDRLSDATLDALERLGRQLVYLEWPLLQRTLDQAVACKAGAPPT